jgi:hypothetical protein
MIITCSQVRILNRRYCDRMVVISIYTYIISAYHHKRFVFDSCSDEICHWLVKGRWFSTSTPRPPSQQN